MLKHTHTPAHSHVVSCTLCSPIYASVVNALSALVTKHTVALHSMFCNQRNYINIEYCGDVGTDDGTVVL